MSTNKVALKLQIYLIAPSNIYPIISLSQISLDLDVVKALEVDIIDVLQP